MKRNVTECDRCGNEIARSRRIVIEPDGRSPDRGVDLCGDCFSAFEAFMDNRAGKGSGVPRGFKRVIRPCPHFVPCADPNGCSGTELVRI